MPVNESGVNGEAENALATLSATMTPGQIKGLPVKELAARDAVLVLRAAWPMLTDGWRTFLVF